MLVEYRKFISNRPFGVEFEVSNTVMRQRIWNVIIQYSHRNAVVTDWQQTHNNRHWHVKTDSTCGPEGKGFEDGFEVASYKAAGLTDLMHIAEIANRLKEYGVQVNDNCGLHVHADASDFTPAQVGVLVAHWFKIEPFMFNCVPPRRKTNEYCQPLRTIYPFLADCNRTGEEVWDYVRPTNLCVFDNYERRVALNLLNYATGLRRKRWTRKTIELRLPEGTLDPVEVRNWIRFFVHFVDFCKNRQMPSNLHWNPIVGDASYYCGLGHEDDCFSIFSPGLFETRCWLLERCAKYGKGVWTEDA